MTSSEQEMEQLAAALAELTRFQQEQERRHEERQLREEEHRRLQEERRRQQYEEHQEQVRTMHEQHAQQLETMMQTLKERRPTEHLKVAAYEEGEDIQDFLEAFEGIMDLPDVRAREWVLRLTKLLKGKARAVCTDYRIQYSEDRYSKYIQHQPREEQEAVLCIDVDKEL